MRETEFKLGVVILVDGTIYTSWHSCDLKGTKDMLC